MRLLVLILTITLVLPAFGQRKKKEEGTVAPAFIEGITYSLPRTGVRIHVQAIKEKFVPGPYAAYAEQLLGITDVKTKANVQWEFENITFETFSEPDPDQVFKAMGDVSYLLSLSPDGCLAGINSSASISEIKQVHTSQLLSKPIEPDEFSFENINDLPQFIPGDSTTNFRPVRLSTDQKAAQAAARVLKCRTTRFEMVAGLMDEFHPDGNAYQVSLEELSEIEKDYLSLFVGRTTSTCETFLFDFVPGSNAEKGEVVFRLSDENGVVPASDLSGKPVMMKVDTDKKQLTKYAASAKSDNPAAGESGVFYRIPAMANVQLIYDMKTIASARISLAQFGVVAPVPEELLYGEFSVEIHPETGVIKKIQKK